MQFAFNSLTLLLVLITSIRPSSSSKEVDSEAYWDNTYVDVSGRHLNVCVSIVKLPPFIHVKNSNL